MKFQIFKMRFHENMFVDAILIISCVLVDLAHIAFFLGPTAILLLMLDRRIVAQ
jgi:hypothetical protein